MTSLHYVIEGVMHAVDTPTDSINVLMYFAVVTVILVSQTYVRT